MPATANAPLTRGNIAASGPESRAEVQLDYADVLRLDQGTEVCIADLARTRIRIQVALGRVHFVAFPGRQADVEIDTPNMAVHVRSEGDYSLAVHAPDSSQLTVRSGYADVYAGSGSKSVASGQAIEVKGREDPDYQLSPVAGEGAWDRWNNERNHAIADAQSWKYTNRYYTGTADLDRYGDWVSVPGYGWCWSPYADAGWVPYRNGRWISDPYYQWIWVGYEPWGWAPYHYGRWLLYDGAWCWWPGLGPKGARPEWAPGYVTFLGLGARSASADTGVQFDSIGWCPLGPHDSFTPWWSSGGNVSTTDFTSLNAVPAADGNPEQVPASNVQGILTNPDLRAAVSTLSVQNFANGRVGNDLYPVNATILDQGSLIQGSLPVRPAKTSLPPVDRPVIRASLPAAGADQHLVFRSMPPDVHGSESASQMSPLASNRPPAANTTTQARLAAPATPETAAKPRENSAVGSATSGPPATSLGPFPTWRRFTRSNNGSQPPSSGNDSDAAAKPQAAPALPSDPPSTPNPAPQGDGWRHFSPPPGSVSHGASVSSPPGGWRRFSPPKDSDSPAPPPQGDQYKI